MSKIFNKYEPIEKQIKKSTKIDAAKSFANCHKHPIFGLGQYSKLEEVPESVWLKIWDFIWEYLSYDAEGEPYIEISKNETKSGNTEIFNLPY